MHAGMDAAYGAAVTSAANNGAVIVDPEDGQVRLLAQPVVTQQPCHTSKLRSYPHTYRSCPRTKWLICQVGAVAYAVHL